MNDLVFSTSNTKFFDIGIVHEMNRLTSHVAGIARIAILCKKTSWLLVRTGKSPSQYDLGFPLLFLPWPRLNGLCLITLFYFISMCRSCFLKGATTFNQHGQEGLRSLRELLSKWPSLSPYCYSMGRLLQYGESDGHFGTGYSLNMRWRYVNSWLIYSVDIWTLHLSLVPKPVSKIEITKNWNW